MKTTLLALSVFMSFSAISAENSFFQGYINACNHSKEYETFQKELCKTAILKDGAQICQQGKTSFPTSMSGKITKTTNNPEHTLFEVTLDKPVTFAGNTIVAIEQWTGHENGIWGSDLVTDSKTVKEAKTKIKSSGVILKQQKSEALGSVGAEVIKGKDGKIRIMCDTSN